MKKQFISQIFALALLLACWFFACSAIRNEYILPSPVNTFKQVVNVAGDSAFHTAFANTMKRVFYSFVISFVSGIVLGMMSYLSSVFKAIIAPFISLVRTIPTMAIILMLLIWTNPLMAPVIVTVMVLFPMCYSMVLASLEEIGTEYSLMAKSFKVGIGRQIFKMYLPLCAPMVLAQLGSVFSMGIKIMISSEVLSLTYRSMGGMMQQAKMYVEITQLFALTLIAVIVGFVVELAFDAFAKLFSRRKK